MKYLHKLDRSELHKVTQFFTNHRTNYLIDTVLEGILGDAFVDNVENPNIAMLYFADIINIGGDHTAKSAINLIEDIPIEKAILPCPKEWERLIRRTLKPRVVDIARKSFSNEKLDLEHLSKLSLNIPEGYIIKRIDRELASTIIRNKGLISEDHVHNYGSVDYFLEKGIGFCGLSQDGTIVAGASSYAVSSKGIEVQINTHKAHRNKGLATCVGAHLIAYCIENGIIPHWDAGNETSSRLAQRLGFTLSESYTALLRIE